MSEKFLFPYLQLLFVDVMDTERAAVAAAIARFRGLGFSEQVFDRNVRIWKHIVTDFVVFHFVRSHTGSMGFSQLRVTIRSEEQTGHDMEQTTRQQREIVLYPKPGTVVRDYFMDLGLRRGRN